MSDGYEEDPDELLSRQRHLVRAWMDHGELDEEGVCELVQVTAQLDAWLTDGGARPLEWRRSPLPRKTDNLPPLLASGRRDTITSGRTRTGFPREERPMAHTYMTETEWDEAVDELTLDTRIVAMLLSLPAEWGEKLPELVGSGRDGKCTMEFAEVANDLYNLMVILSGEDPGLRAQGLVPCALLKLAQDTGLVR